MTHTKPLTPRRTFARQYAEARRFRRDMRQGQFLNTAFSLASYIRAIRACWQHERRNPA